MNRRHALAALGALVASPSIAIPTSYQRSKMFWEPVSYLNGGPGGSGIVSTATHPALLELPDPCYIVAMELLEQSSSVADGVDAILMIKMDRAGRFTNSTGFPAGEICAAADPICNADLFRLVVLDLKPGGQRIALKQHNPPVRYSRAAGDKLMINSSGTSPGGATAIQVCWTIYYQVDA